MKYYFLFSEKGDCYWSTYSWPLEVFFYLLPNMPILGKFWQLAVWSLESTLVWMQAFRQCTCQKFRQLLWEEPLAQYINWLLPFQFWFLKVIFKKNSSNHLIIQKIFLKLTMIFQFSSSGNQQCTWKWSRMAVFTWIDHNSRNSSVDHFAILSGISQIPTIGEKQTRRSHQSFRMVSVIFFSWSPFLWKWFHEKNHRPEFSKK